MNELENIIREELDERLGGRDFDPHLLWRAMGTWSHGEQLLAKFCLHIWNPYFLVEKNEPFDLLETVGRLDQKHRDAIAAWVKDPIIP